MSENSWRAVFIMPMNFVRGPRNLNMACRALAQHILTEYFMLSYFMRFDIKSLFIVKRRLV